jgi:lysyl-tRNA synthetase class 2
VSLRDADWQPAATLERLRTRAQLLARARDFFATRGVLEVDTPLLVNAPVSDVHMHCAVVDLGAPRKLYLHTSPEYAMKRLLAAGAGDIYQICHVVRGFECGRLHNPEFVLIEWYRCGFTLKQLMDEVEALVRELLGAAAPAPASEKLTYQDAFQRTLHLDPLTATPGELLAAAAPLTLSAAASDLSRDGLLELLMGSRVGPSLGRGRLTFVHGYPATQAALARVDPQDPRTAERFELYCEGIELANGFHELADAGEQRARFAADNDARSRAQLPVAPPDERLLAALASGLPDCTGVALGFERVLMLATAARHIDEVLPFPSARA